MTDYIHVNETGEVSWIPCEAIVRCRDCIYMREQPWNAMTATGLWCLEHDIPVNADGYCAWGERKGGCE